MSKCDKISGSVLAYRKSCVIGRQVDAQRGIGKLSGDCLRNQFVESLILRVSVACSILSVIVDITHGPVKTVCEYHEVW